MEKILLIQPSNNMDDLLGNGKVFVHATEPLGLLYIAAVLEKNGFDVCVLDAFSLNMSIDDVKDYIKNGKWDAIGISCITSNGAFTFYLGKWLKREFPNILVFLGNIHASVYADFYLKQRAADIVVHGEGELTVVDILKNRESLRKIEGISWYDHGNVIENHPRPLMENLDDLPLPARHLVDMSKYTSRDFTTKSTGSYRVMFSSRGCVNKCTFCVVHQSKYRMRSAEAVVDEMSMLVQDYQAGFIEFLDPLFTVSKKRVIQICQLIKDRAIDVEWQCEAHVNTVDEEMLMHMKNAGCVNIAYGIESGVQELLDNIKKRTKLEDIRNVVQMTRDSGIRAFGLFMIGIPGETAQMTNKTIRFAKSLPLYYAQFAITVPYPGSEMYYELMKNGEMRFSENPAELVENWIRYSTYISFTDNMPIYVPEGRTGEELKKFQKKAILLFYLRPSNIFNEFKKIKIKNWRSYFLAVKAVFFD